MATKLFVVSLSWNTTDESLQEFFASAGTVVSASVIKDRETNRSKGFGFVEMSSDDEAKQAIEKLNNQELDGRSIIVSEARPREDKPRSFGGGGGGNHSGGGNRRDFRSNDRY